MQKKAQTMMMGFLIKLIIAVIAVLLVIVLIVALWNAIFPSKDRATIQSFETLYSQMNFFAGSSKSYESLRFSVYIRDGYRIFYFDKKGGIDCKILPDNKLIKRIQRPSVCGTASCICLYSGEPDEDSKNENVQECKKFNTDFGMGSFELSKSTCAAPNGGPYYPLILASENTMSSGAAVSKTLYVWLDNDANRLLDSSKKRPRCSSGSSDTLCKDQYAGLIAPGAGASYAYTYITGGDVYRRCLSEHKYTAVGICTYNPDSNACSFSCSDVDMECGYKINTCEDYTAYSLDGQFVGTYMLESSPAYWACTNDKDVCHVAGKNSVCKADPMNYYVCSAGSRGDCENELKTIVSAIGEECRVKKEGTFSTGVIMSFKDRVLDADKKSCSSVISATAFKPAPVYVLKDPNDDIFSKDPEFVSKCALLVLSNQQITVNVYAPGARVTGCQDTIKVHMDPIYGCVQSSSG